MVFLARWLVNLGIFAVFAAGGLTTFCIWNQHAEDDEPYMLANSNVEMPGNARFDTTGLSFAERQPQGFSFMTSQQDRKAAKDSRILVCVFLFGIPLAGAMCLSRESLQDQFINYLGINK